MSWYALDALDDARSETESLLLPVEAGRWLRLALLAFFVGGVGGSVSVNGESGAGGVPVGGPSVDVPTSVPSVPPRTLLLAVVGFLVAFVAAFLVYALLGAVAEFVLVEGLRRRNVRIRTPFRRYFRDGLRLFLFRLLVWTVAVVVVLAPLVAAVALGATVTPAAFLLAVPAVALLAVGGLLTLVVLRLTTDFVVPTMLVENRPVFDAWRRFYGVLDGQWAEFGLYALVRLALGVGAAVAVGIATLLVGLVVAVPFAVVGGVAYFALAAGGPGLAGWILLGGVAALFLLALLVVALLVQVPVVTFLRYYALAVLGRADSGLDLLGPAGETAADAD